MARLRKCKLVWAAADTEDIVGYKLYWASGTTVDYHCDAVKVGKVSEIEIPACVDWSKGPVMFGITAIDREGNESDMTTLAEPFHRRAPLPPQRLCLEPADGHVVIEEPEEEEIEPEVIQRLIAQLEDEDPPGPDVRQLHGQDEEEEEGPPGRFDIGSIF